MLLQSQPEDWREFLLLFPAGDSNLDPIMEQRKFPQSHFVFFKSKKSEELTLKESHVEVHLCHSAASQPEEV